MYRSAAAIRLVTLAVALGIGASRAGGAGAPEAQPPKGFTALFNGRDLIGFYGLEHFDPRKLRAVTEEDPIERDEQTFTSIFNGRDFTGWAGPLDNYEIVDGAIRCKPKKGGTIYTQKEYSDFVVRLEFRLPPAGNNGLAIRYPGEGDAAYAGMTELQVLDNTAPVYATLDARQFHGSAYGMVAAKRDFLRPVGEWNYEQVTVKGSTVKVELNGTTILDADLSTVTEFLDNKAHPGKDRTTGHFGFAGHNDPVEYRRVRVKEL